MGLPDLTRDQFNRGALIGAVLDINVNQWEAKLIELGPDGFPKEIEAYVVGMIEALRAQVGDEPDPECGMIYLQSIASCSDAALAWLGENIGGTKIDLMP